MRKRTALALALAGACTSPPPAEPVPRPEFPPDPVVRVLYVDHLPRWEYRFHKSALKRDPRALCHFLLTSADRDSPQECSDREGKPPDLLTKENEFYFRPPPGFPRTPAEMLRYDVIVLGDVRPETLGGRQVQEDLVRFVEERGGGLVFLAGTRVNPDGYTGTPLEKLLPVIPAGASTPSAESRRPLGYLLTEAGRRHPITQFPPEPEETRRAWEHGSKRVSSEELSSLIRRLGSEVYAEREAAERRLCEIGPPAEASLRAAASSDDPEVRQRVERILDSIQIDLSWLPGIFWYRRVERLRPGAECLVEVRDAGAPGGRAPLFVAWSVGSGRVFLSLTDETWRWRKMRGDELFFHPFFRRVLVWCSFGRRDSVR